VQSGGGTRHSCHDGGRNGGTRDSSAGALGAGGLEGAGGAACSPITRPSGGASANSPSANSSSANSSSANDAGVVALEASGLGGVGKTQLAIEYCHRQYVLPPAAEYCHRQFVAFEYSITHHASVTLCALAGICPLVGICRTCAVCRRLAT
jgi:hypothetical protein